MIKKRISFVSTVLLILALMGTVVAYSSMKSVQSTYFSLTGTHDGWNYAFGVSGNTISVTGSTLYEKSSCSRSINITCAYISSNFLRYQTVNGSSTRNTGTSSTNVTVSDPIFERFISAYTIHEIDGWQYDQTCGVY